MPVKIEAFACEFRCGRIARKQESLFLHEKTCFKNPDRRACKTCKHNAREPYESDTGAGGCFVCEIDKLPPGKTTAINCEHWQNKNDFRKEK
jgi:hypothetical protein